MKKLILLCAAMISAGMLNSMAPENHHKTLLPELKQEIINTALAISENSDKKISMIEKLSALHGISYDKLFNLKDFTKLVHWLVGEDLYQIHIVAEKFNIPIAHEYLKLNKDLIKLINAKDSNVETIVGLINSGADVNFLDTTNRSYHLTPLTAAMRFPKPEVVKFLLESGAELSNSYVQRELSMLKAKFTRYPNEQLGINAKIIHQMIEDALKNKSGS